MFTFNEASFHRQMMNSWKKKTEKSVQFEQYVHI